MTVSVVIAAFNPRPGDLERAVASIASQTHNDWDCVVVDDGSERPIFLDVEGVRVVRQQNAGVSAARNRGLCETTGSLVAFLDQDDWWHPQKLERQVHYMTTRGLAMCDTDFHVLRDGEVIANGYPDHLGDFQTLLSVGRFGLSTLLVERQVLVESGGFSPLFPQVQDWDLGLRIGRRHPFDRLREVLATYTIHGANATQDYWRTYSEQTAILNLYEHLDPVLEPAIEVGRSSLRKLYSYQAVDAFRANREAMHLWNAMRLSPSVLARSIGATARRRLGRDG